MEQLDPEMLKNLDLLIDLDVVNSEADWEILDNMQDAEAGSSESVDSNKEKG